jgi:rhodanese-related sulfurtransferase
MQDVVVSSSGQTRDGGPDPAAIPSGSELMSSFFRSYLALGLILVGPVVAAAGLRSPGIDPEALGERLKGPQAPLVVDVRSPAEYSSGHVPGAVNVPAPTVTRHLDAIIGAKDVVLYCNDKQFTAVAERLLLKSNVTGFLHLEGGLTAWRERGLPLETSLPE